MTAPTAGPFGLYRWYDVDDLPIYFGVSGSMAARQTTHAKQASWGIFAHHSTVERFDTWEAALEAERIAIETDRPIFNRTHNGSAEARRRVEEYLTAHDRNDLLPPARTSPSSRLRPEVAADVDEVVALYERRQEIEAEYKGLLAQLAQPVGEVPIAHLAKRLGLTRKTVYRHLGRSMT